MVSIIIPSRNEIFLSKTIEDILNKARGEIEVIPVLEGYWPVEQKREHWTTSAIIDDPRVIYIHHSKPRGMRRSINEGVAIAKGEFIMKVDAHIMFDEGFDVKLAADCEDNWVSVPTRKRLDPEKWEVSNGRPPINYLYIQALPVGDRIETKEWRQKNKDRSLDKIEIEDTLGFQGSCFFMPKKYYHELELLDEENYGTFRKDPQEVIFKAWTSGGRVIRNKKTWYAHLHKGKRYGRMYNPNRADHKKGDEYIKKWWTDSAWDKQRKPFKWLIQKFPGMPGWENHEWFKEPEKKLLPTYQHLEVNGKPFTRARENRTNSRFWGEGRWKNFIEPLLPKDCSEQTFVEMGCDAGLFLKLAKDKGYRNVVGIEKNHTPYKAGNQYRDAIGYDYTLLKRILGGKFGGSGNFDFKDIPVADLTLMSTFHYYVDLNTWYKYLDQLKAKTCYCLIVSRPDTVRKHWVVNSQLGYLDKYFNEWEKVKVIDNIPEEGDPNPRKLFSVLYKSPTVRRVPIDKITTRQQGKAVDADGVDSKRSEIYKATKELAGQLAKGEKIDPFKSVYYEAWKKRKDMKWSERTIRHVVKGKYDLIKSIIKDGLKDPILVQKDTLKLSDGGHRLAILGALDCKSVIVREV